MTAIRTVAMAALLCLSGCAATPTRDTFSVHCAGKEQCDYVWQRAQVWVAENSGYRIQTTSDALIQTFGPCCSKPQLAFAVTKLPEGDNHMRIQIRAACDNVFGCQPTAQRANMLFAAFVWEGWKKPN